MKLLLMNTDNRNSWSLDGRMPAPPSEPGATIQVVSAFPGPLLFAALNLGRAARELEGKSVGPRGVIGIDLDEPVSRWRIDDVRIDGAKILAAIDAVRNTAVGLNHHDQGVDSCRVTLEPFAFGRGSEVSIAATNVGDAPAYFYAAWEMADVP